MTSLDNLADGLHRTVKLALDSGEAATVDEAVRIFAGYRLQLVIGPNVADDPGLQAAALTAVNCAARTLLGGVVVVGAQGPLRVSLPPFGDPRAALEGLGARLASGVDPSVPTLVLGAAPLDGLEPLAIRAIVNGWAGGVVPAWLPRAVSSAPGIAPAGVLAGALAVSEVFQRLRGNVKACRRAVGLDLWRPERDWRPEAGGPLLSRLPSAAWLVGLGNLGQAYLWTLGLLPYGRDGADVVLQDFDVLAPSNVSTSLGMPHMLAHGYQVLIQTAAGAGEFPFMIEDSLVTICLAVVAIETPWINRERTLSMTEAKASDAVVRYELSERVARITLARPPAASASV
jgi:hypothetical protein